MTDQIRAEAAGPEAVRAEIENTRARMSATIDEIEDVLVERKERWRERLDIPARVRQKPLQAAGVVFGIGLLFGFLSGGSGDRKNAVRKAEERAALWEDRARRLLEIARKQEEELAMLEESEGHGSGRRDHEHGDRASRRVAEMRAATAETLGRLARRAQGRLDELRR